MKDNWDNWIFACNYAKDMVYYLIMKNRGSQIFDIIFDVQLPRKVPSHYKWSSIVQEHIQKDLDDFIKIFPKYMQDICDEHNGLKRIDSFPDYKIGHIDYNARCICIGGDGEKLQIAGGNPEDLGENFMENFVKGLKGDWKNINF